MVIYIIWNIIIPLEIVPTLFPDQFKKTALAPHDCAGIFAWFDFSIVKQSNQFIPRRESSIMGGLKRYTQQSKF